MSQDYKTDNVNLMIGDCLRRMKEIPDGSIDCIIDDLPYNVTNKSSEAGKWDVLIPFEPLWDEFLRVAKENAAMILFCQGIFTAQVMMSKPSLYRYSLVWDKCRSSGFLNSKKMPLRNHEDICVFYRKLPTYNPQMTKAEKGKETHTKGKAQNGESRTNRCYGNFVCTKDNDLTMKFPTSILRFPRPHCTGNHPTEKSVDLCRWLVRTYTNDGETVLDATMGSGTTGVASILEGRRFVGIEMEDKYFDVAKRRIKEAMATPKQGTIEI